MYKDKGTNTLFNEQLHTADSQVFASGFIQATQCICNIRICASRTESVYTDSVNALVCCSTLR